jgi:16S rRNA (uracil1498-N3)-methyltransferase
LQLFYATNIQETRLFLSQEETNHAKNVLRLKENDTIQVTDGIGNLYSCKVSSLKGKEAELTIVSKTSDYGKHNYYLQIAIAPTKNIDRIEWFVEKAIEIGINEISFIQSERSERKHINIERMEKISVSAMKQSVKAYIPKLNELQPLTKFISNYQRSTIKHQLFIAHLEDERKFLKDLLLSSTQRNYTILIGPEGDFSPKEIDLSLKSNFQPVSLGNSRLRTETAGIVACSITNTVLA